MLAMIHEQNKDPQMTELLIGGVQIGTPQAKQQWVDDFLASRPQNTSMNTFRYYQTCLYPAVGIDLTPKGINDWLTNVTKGNAKLSYYRAIKAFCNWLYKSKKIVKNPIDFVDKPKTAKRILPAITQEQLVTLIKNVTTLRDACLLRFLFDSGCRLSEVSGVEAKDFHYDTGLVTVIGKGNKQRRAPFTIATGEMLQEWFAEHDTFELSNEGISSFLDRLESNTGITCNAHCFRRGFAIHQFKQGVSTRNVQLMGGWESITMVERYTQQLSQDDAFKHYDRG
ncbi:hypothetical protein DRO66_08295 [Candidatus Bathyarchaeota archaeon]|nr:MAG: hypothetical protein DRO66_08295 [Candidatus Bathyarchaeota archaeon]